MTSNDDIDNTAPDCNKPAAADDIFVLGDLRFIRRERIRPDRGEAERFLTALDPTTLNFTFQTFDDNVDRATEYNLKHDHPDWTLTRVLHGSLDRHWDTLCQLNAAGAGIFVTINETDFKGRKEKNVVRVRSLFIDLDKGEPLPKLHAEPHIIVESSPFKWHVYWLVKDCKLDQFEALQRRLIHAYGSDNVHDLSRVLRVPGFIHRKVKDEMWSARFLSRLVDARERARYTTEEAVAGLPAEKERERAQQDDGQDRESAEPQADIGRIAMAMAVIPNNDRDWDPWNDVGLAIYRATGASEQGFRIFDAWSQKSSKYNAEYTRAKWNAYHGCPPNRIGAGSIFHWANEACPGWDEEPTPGEGSPRVIHWQGEIDTRANQPWLVAGLIPERGKGLISGQWGTFKTFAAMDLAATIAWGGTFLDYAVRRQGGTLFVAAEGAFQVPTRLQGLMEKKSPNPQKKKIPFAWVDSCPSLLRPNGVKQIVADAKEVDAKMRQRFGVPLVMVVVDTVISAAGYTKAGDENDAAIGSRVMRALEEISRQTGTFVFGVDHFGKSIETGTRGSSAKEDSADVVLSLLGDRQVSGRVTNTRLAVRKSRGGESGQEFPFTASVIDMGEDEFGTPITTRIIEWGKGQEAAGDSGGWDTRPLKTFRHALMAILVEAGVDHKPKMGDGPAVRAVEVETVRAEFYRTYFVDGGKQGTKRQAFNRAMDEAGARDLVRFGEDDLGRGLVWFAQPKSAGDAGNAGL
jgi:hypothetical protein